MNALTVKQNLKMIIKEIFVYLKENVVFLLNYLNKTVDKPNIEENPIMKLTLLLDD